MLDPVGNDEERVEDGDGSDEGVHEDHVDVTVTFPPTLTILRLSTPPKTMTVVAPDEPAQVTRWAGAVQGCVVEPVSCFV